MAAYKYKAMDELGRVKTGKANAANATDLEARLQKMGLDLLSCKQARAAAGSGWGRGVARRDLILFCFHLEQTARAGVPILESLQDLRDSVEKAHLREIVSAMLESIEGGKTLSEAMADFPGVFPEAFANVVRAGEQAGKLGAALERLGENLKWQDEQASLTRKLLMYPVYVAAVVGGALFFLMIYLVPELLAFVKTTGSVLPAHTLLLISVSDFFARHWALILLAPALTAGFIGAGVKSNAGLRLLADRLKLKLPVFGPVLQKLILARLSGFFAMMYSSGITIVDCIKAGEGIAGNKAVAMAMKDVGQAIAAGKSLSEGLGGTGLFPPLVVRMIRVGETTGALGPSLENVAYFYTRDVRESVARLQAVIEPALTVALGGLIGWIVFSVLGPIYDLITDIKV